MEPVGEPQNPMDVVKGSMELPAHLSTYLVERKYLNMPYPEFRDELPATEEQIMVFKDFYVKHLPIRGLSEDRTLGVGVLIPKRVLRGEALGQYSVHVRFHGGGFCTGSPTFKPWFALHVRNLSLEHNAITLMPKYRKMPESHGREILNDADIFWEWYQSRQFYLDLQTLFLGSGTNRTDVNTKIDRHQLFVSGESAGGFLAAYSWLSQPDLRIEALYMQYPMLRAYTRRSGEPYRGKVIPEHEVQEYAKVYCDHITALKALDKINPRTDSVPPEGMDMAYMFSSAKKEVIMNGKKTRISYWKWWFRQPDILERLEELVNRAQDTQAGVSAIVQEDAPVPGTAQRQTSQPTKAETETPTFTLPKANHAIPSYCPPMFISHGIEDTNCPAQDTQEFMRLVKQLFPEASIRLELRPEQAHGFDYTLDEWDLEQRWLLQLCIAIASAWIPGDAVETAAIRSCRPSPSPSEDVSLPDFPPGSGSIEGPTSASQSVTLRDTDSEGPGRGDSTEADRTLLTPDSAGLAGATPSSEDTSMCSHGGRSGNTRNEL